MNLKDFSVRIINLFIKEQLDLDIEYINDTLSSLPVFKSDIIYESKGKYINKLNNEEDLGYILVNKDLHEFKECIITLIHERIHSFRNVLLYDVNQSSGYINDNKKAYCVDNSKRFQYVDYSQSILKGSIDDTKTSKWDKMTVDELDRAYFNDEVTDRELIFQYNIDESLIEVIATLALKNYLNCKDIYTLVREVYDESDSNLIRLTCALILKHQDLELLKWELFPIEYTCGDCHYDFFRHYTRNDNKSYINDYYDEDELGIEEESMLMVI